MVKKRRQEIERVRIWSALSERKRLENLALARRLIRRSIDHQVLVDYRPGHVWYNYAEYPAEPLSRPDEADELKFARYRELGIEVFKIHEEWNDAFEVYGADKFTPTAPEAFRALIDRVHAHGMKFLPYISSGYYDKRSRSFRPRWANYLNGKIKSLTGGYYDLAECSPRSPEWRAFLLGAVERLMSEYPLDGLYNDVGYNSLAMYDPPDPKQGLVDAFEESPQRDGAFEDLTQELYTVVKRHRGIYTTHFGRYYRSYNNYFTPDLWPPRFKCYDYTFVGEAVGSLDALLRKVRRQPPFVLYIPDWRYIEKQQPGLDPRAVYALSIPYLQFPVLYDGRPIAGRKYRGRRLKYLAVETGELPWPDQVAGYYRKHPQAAPIYSPWEQPPGNPRYREDYFHYFPIYRKMTRPGSHVFIEIQDQDLLAGRFWRDLVLSAFVNEEFYLVAASYFHREETLVLKDVWEDAETGRRSREWKISPWGIKILRRL